ncbi:LysR family transcriptional regulator [Streptomyces fuscichromogenes]|uniref:LysR family transcriptional regulator n=1 Tax=Streptomyces fuscichromogenes TaxID=1324013 RepID=A0A917XGD1_9ACTN|nr:LysR family transcriptional regulator [Streptomyces fuscichromogenes]GGN19228.1 LysR family transcriptional regulator [Streptomyces fuscichromogenes]
MERRQIEYFLAVIDHAGITAAATALHVSQPSLSHAIKLLESDLGAKLFHRMPRGVRLTPAGEAFAGSARRVLRELDAGRAAVKAVSGLVAGRLDLVSLPGLLLDPLAGAVGRFRTRYPEVKVRIVPAERPQAVREAVRSGAAELGLTDHIDPGERDLAGDLVAEHEMVVALPPGSTPPPGGVFPVSHLRDLDLVTGARGMVVDLLTQASAETESELTPAVEIGLRASSLYLVLAGAGAAVLPRPLAELGRPHGVVIAPLDPPKRRQGYLMRRAAPLSPAARAMHTLLLSGRPGPS